jgi:hypothetical protein
MHKVGVPRAAKRGLHFLPRDVGVQDPTPKFILLLRGDFNQTLNLLAVTIRQKELQTADSQASMTFPNETFNSAQVVDTI